jgi:LysR family glycine cleavage system transcriptional activator
MHDRFLPSLNAVRTFAAAARHLSFTRAAAELHVTQGAVSRMVQGLEAELGVRLFRRAGRAIELTPAGAAFHDEVSQALDRIAAATRSVRQSGGRVLSVSVLPTFALRWLVPRLPSFQSANPDILVDVTTSERLVDFAKEPVDVAVRYGRGGWPGTEATPLMPEHVGVFCAPSVLERGPPLRGAEDLPAHRLLQHTTRPDAWRAYFAAFGLPPPDVTQSPGLEHFFMIIEAAAAGMGVALLPTFLARDDVAAGRLVQPFGQVLRQRNAYFIVHAPGAGAVRRIRRFKDWLLAEAGTSGDAGRDGPAGR